MKTCGLDSEDSRANDTSQKNFHNHEYFNARKTGEAQVHRRKGSDSVSKDLGFSFTQEGFHKQSNATARSTTTNKTAGKSREQISPSRRRQKSEHSRAKCLGDIVEPLNAQRLRPIRQKTRNAVVSILEEGEVCLEFYQPKNGQDLVMEVIRISSNGMKVSVYQPNGKKGTPLTSRPPPLSAETTYLFSTLSSKYWKKYQYAARFVQLVRKKTPKVSHKQKHSLKQ